MTFLGVVGIFLGLLGARFAAVKWTGLRLYVFTGTYILHLCATYAYYIFALNNVSDAAGYYLDYNYYYQDVGLSYGTAFVTYIVQRAKGAFGGTFLDYFMLFQAISFFGICLIMRIIEEIYAEVQIEQPLYTYLLPLLPGLHFWTSPIGKDGFLLLAGCLALWAAMNIRSRYPAMVAGFVVMLIIRPYIAPVAFAALGGAFFFERGRPWLRIGIIFLSLVGLAFALSTVKQTFSLDVTSADSVSDWLAAHEEVTADAETAGNSAVHGSYAFKLMSLLFRPMFIDAGNIMGYAASIENAVFLILLVSIFLNIRTTAQLAKRLSFVRFAILFGTLVALVLAVGYFNIGLGLRHKTMFVPAIIVIFAAVMAVRRARRMLAPTGATPPPRREILPGAQVTR